MTVSTRLFAEKQSLKAKNTVKTKKELKTVKTTVTKNARAPSKQVFFEATDSDDDVAKYPLKSVEKAVEKKNKNEEATAVRAAGKSWYQIMISDNDYTEFENFSKWFAVSQ